MKWKILLACKTNFIENCEESQIGLEVWTNEKGDITTACNDKYWVSRKET